MPITLGDTSITGLGVGGGIPANTLNGRVPSSNANLGSILQVVQGTYDGGASMNGQGVTLDVVSCTITPTSSSSRILLMSHFLGGSNDAGGNSVWFRRNSTDIGQSSQTGTGQVGTGFWLQSRYYSPSDNQGGGSMFYVDSPSTTSAITYTVRVRNRTDSSNALRLNLNWAYSSNTVGFQHPGVCTIIAMEVAS
jgi:hypothetical protein